MENEVKFSVGRNKDLLVDPAVQDFLEGRNGTKYVYSKRMTDCLTRIKDALNYDPYVTTEIKRTPNTKSKYLVSVIIVNWNGKELLRECLDSIGLQTYSNIEVVLVDNDSEDDSVQFVRKMYPEVIIVQNERNEGFSGGNNIGYSRSTGDLCFLLNSDTRIAPDCVEELVKSYEIHKDDVKIGAIVPKVKLYHNPAFINIIGNSVFYKGWGSDNFINYLDLGQFDHVQKVMSACFAAVIIPRRVIEELGLLDEAFYMYYEDADWSYRARMRGYEIITATESVVYHKFSASTSKRPNLFKHYHLVKNRQRFALLNLEKSNVIKVTKRYFKEDLLQIRHAIREKDLRQIIQYVKSYLYIAVHIISIYRLRSSRQRSRVIWDLEISAQSEEPNLEIVSNGSIRLNMKIVRQLYFDVFDKTSVPIKFLITNGIVHSGSNGEFASLKRKGKVYIKLFKPISNVSVIDLQGVANSGLTISVGNTQITTSKPSSAHSDYSRYHFSRNCEVADLCIQNNGNTICYLSKVLMQ